MEERKLQVGAKKELIDYGFEENGKHYWKASWYAKVLGYKSLQTMKSVIDKSKKLCVQLDISVEKNFVTDTSYKSKDIKLTKFACFLISLQADGRKPVVKRAISYFLKDMGELSELLFDQDYLHRQTNREELKRLNTELSRVAARSHVRDFQYFTNEGYLGMYNYTMPALKEKRGLSFDDNLNDAMSTPELMANIFRIVLTKERLKRIKNPSEEKAARHHWKIGLQIRTMILDSTGKYPESMPLQKELAELKGRLKKAAKELNKDLPSSNQGVLQYRA